VVDDHLVHEELTVHLPQSGEQNRVDPERDRSTAVLAGGQLHDQQRVLLPDHAVLQGELAAGHVAVESERRHERVGVPEEVQQDRHNVTLLIKAVQPRSGLRLDVVVLGGVCGEDSGQDAVARNMSRERLVDHVLLVGHWDALLLLVGHWDALVLLVGHWDALVLLVGDGILLGCGAAHSC